MSKFRIEIISYTHSDSRFGNLARMRPEFELASAAPKQLNLKKLGDAGELKSSGCRRRQKPNPESEWVFLERKGLTAEIYYDDELWAEISTEEDQFLIAFCPPTKGNCWEFNYENALEIIEKAQTMLKMTRNKGTLLERSTPINATEVNKQAEEILEEIINHPQKETFHGTLARFGAITDIVTPDKRGARFSAKGEFIGFLEM